MNSETIILAVIMVLVLIVIPAALGRLTGKNPMEIFFGRRANESIFGKKKDPGGREQETDPSAGRKERDSRKSGSGNDLLSAISDVVSYARRNHFRVIVPGTLSVGGETASLAVILITRCRVIGINCFGYPGKIQVMEGDANWKQTVDGVSREFESPVRRCRKQAALLAEALSECGCGSAESEVAAVFTSPHAELTGNRTQNGISQYGCYTRTTLKHFLASEHCMNAGTLEPEKVEAALLPMIRRERRK